MLLEVAALVSIATVDTSTNKVTFAYQGPRSVRTKARTREKSELRDSVPPPAAVSVETKGADKVRVACETYFPTMISHP